MKLTPWRSGRGRAGVPAVFVVLGLVLAACGGPSLPASVTTGTKVAVAWPGVLTSLNAATAAGATAGDRDVAAMTRSHFAEVVEGKVVPDTSFGKVTIVRKQPFTVRYDLAKPVWSDGIAVDAADLLLAWAAGSDTAAGFEPASADLAKSDHLVAFEESKRAIEVSFSEPEPDWNTALDVAVPAHVVGRLAFGLDDPMEAKKAVTDAIRDGDEAALAKIAKAWNGGFSVDAGTTPAGSRLLSSGPYRIEKVSGADGAQRVDLIANGAYAGAQKPTIARVSLRQTADDQRLAVLGTSADVVELTPTIENWQAVHDLERRDYQVGMGNDGTMWVLALRTDHGLFTRPKASAAFLRSVPRGDLISAGAGGWDDAYTGSDALVYATGSAGYDEALEDSGFQEKLGKAGNGTDDLTAAGLQPGTKVCVAYDSSSEFARGAFGAMVSGMSEAGWVVTDCGKAGLAEPADAPKADAALVRVAVPQDPAGLAALWRSDAEHSLTGVSDNERDALLDQLALTTDPYDARDLRGQIERTIVDDAVALPIAMNPVVTVTSPRISGVKVRPGPVAPVTAYVAEWGLS
ncbi:MAG: ABC transporter substrate-binding protein [Nocardioides sp.]|uniref:ABC transporter substrate-binding protein n=1 Tax=Nocardioides sp. TaxID=35761 RepID=UPI0039E5C00A